MALYQGRVTISSLNEWFTRMKVLMPREARSMMLKIFRLNILP